MKVVVKKNFVGVVAQKPWQAIQAANELKVNWTPGAGLPKQADFYDHLRNQKPTRDTLLVDLEGCGSIARASRYRGEGHLSSSLSDARVDGQLVRGRRRAGR